MAIRSILFYTFLFLFSSHVFAVDSLLGIYNGVDDLNDNFEIIVSKSGDSTTRFEKVMARTPWGNIELAKDQFNNEFRGFVSSHCDSPNCLWIQLLELKLKKIDGNYKIILTMKAKYNLEEPNESGISLEDRSFDATLEKAKQNTISLKFPPQAMTPMHLQKIVSDEVVNSCNYDPENTTLLVTSDEQDHDDDNWDSREVYFYIAFEAKNRKTGEVFKGYATAVEGFGANNLGKTEAYVEDCGRK